MAQESEKGVVLRAPTELGPSKLTQQDVKDIVDVIKLAEELVMDVLEPGIDWGLHPGTTSYALKDPGAAKILNAFRCYSDPDIIRHVADDHQISFVIKTKLIHRMTGEVMGTGIGSCSTTETKYRYRWVSADQLEREGAKKEGLKTKKRKGGDGVLYRVSNPEWEELENTIFKMACKRAEVDGAQGLPGVGTALGKVFGHPVERTYRWFWPLAQRLGFPNEEAVHKVLGVSSMKDWLGKRTLDDAVEVLISTPAPKPKTEATSDKATLEKAPEPEPALEEPWLDEESALPRETQDQRGIAWRLIKGLLNETKPKADLVTAWFLKYFVIPVDLTDFDAEHPPEKFTEQMLSRFHDSLLALKEQQTHA